MPTKNFCPYCAADLALGGNPHATDCINRNDPTIGLTSGQVSGTVEAVSVPKGRTGDPPIAPAGSDDMTTDLTHYEFTIPPMPEDLPDPVLSENALTVLERRYLLRDEEGEIVETPREMFWRVATYVASAEKSDFHKESWARSFYIAMARGDFMPNSPVLMNAGTGRGTLSACFVIPVNDTMEGILEGASAAGMVQKYGGGTGFSFSRLRHRGDYISGTQGNACGPVSTLLHYDDVARLITQGGKREGANMGVLRYDHPDIMDFVRLKHNVSRCKACHGKLAYQEGVLVHADPADHDVVEDETARNFNISVAVDDTFINAVRADHAYPLVNYRRLNRPIKPVEYESPSGREIRTVTGTVMARDVFDAIVEEAWYSGDPGLLFTERMNTWRSNPIALGFRGDRWWIDATNPCGEKPLFDWDSCILGHINALHAVRDGEIDWEYLSRLSYLATRFLDDVIDVNHLPLPQIEETSKALRRIGVGVMGWADALFALGVTYGSPASISLAHGVAGYIERESWAASRDLVIEGRAPFPMYKQSIYAHHEGVSFDVLPDYMRDVPIRNAIRTTIAPTGTTAIIAGVSSGIEPAFRLAFTRQHKIAKEDGQNVWFQMKELNPVLAEWSRQHTAVIDSDLAGCLERGDTLKQALARCGYTLEVPDYFVTAFDVDWAAHIRMQAAWQAHIDDGVSKTINFAESATVDDFKRAYLLAHETGCLGITCYRDGSRSYQVLGVRAANDDSTIAVERAVSEQSTDQGERAEGSERNSTQERADEREGFDLLVRDLRAVGVEHIERRATRKRLPADRLSRTHKFSIGGQEGYLTIGFYEDGCPGEIFLKIAKNGSTLQGLTDMMGLLVSLLFQYGVSVDEVAEKLEYVIFEPQGFTTNRNIPNVKSIADYVAKFLRQEYGNGKRASIDDTWRILTHEQPSFPKMAITTGPDEVVPITAVASGDVCPKCGQPLSHESGCSTCYACGWSSC